MRTTPSRFMIGVFVSIGLLVVAGAVAMYGRVRVPDSEWERIEDEFDLFAGTDMTEQGSQRFGTKYCLITCAEPSVVRWYRLSDDVARGERCDAVGAAVADWAGTEVFAVEPGFRFECTFVASADEEHGLPVGSSISGGVLTFQAAREAPGDVELLLTSE